MYSRWNREIEQRAGEEETRSREKEEQREGGTERRNREKEQRKGTERRNREKEGSVRLDAGTPLTDTRRAVRLVCSTA